MSTFATGPDPVDRADLRPLVNFAAVAVPLGWLLLSVPLVTGLPLDPFVLATLYLGLVVPATLLTRRDPHASVRALFRDAVRLPRPVWLLVPATLLIPVGTAAVARLLGAGTDLSPAFLGNLALTNVLSSLIIVNLWEELAWAGFVQRRAMARWGYAGGSVITALLFTAVHLPLAFYGADSAGSVGYNVGVMIVAGIGMRLLIGAFDRWGRRSILALGLIHATFNASSELVDPRFDWVRYVVTLGLGLTALAVYPRNSGRTGRRTTGAGGSRSSDAEHGAGMVHR
jgi:membrane protease YdiL (CAAX protease family)